MDGFRIDDRYVLLLTCFFFVVLSELGEVLSLQKRWEQADKTLRQALSLQRKHLSENHYQTARSKMSLND